jgi:hypothetical protein
MDAILAALAGIIGLFAKEYFQLFKEIRKLEKREEKPIDQLIKIMELYHNSSNSVVSNIFSKLLSPTSSYLAAKYVITINAGLFRVVIDLAEKSKKRNGAVHKGTNENFDLTIAGMLLGKKAKENSVAIFLGIIGIVLHLLFSLSPSIETNTTLLGVLVGFIAAVMINQKLLEFRITHGYYGKNSYEAKEMIEFLISHSDKSDFSDGDGIKKLFPLPIPVTKKQSASISGEAGAVT